jgi:lysine-specific histone demethylase 1B
LIIDALANGVDISLNTPVKSINYQGETIVVTATNGSTFEADKVIVTVPLGVLQSNSI